MSQDTSPKFNLILIEPFYFSWPIPPGNRWTARISICRFNTELAVYLSGKDLVNWSICLKIKGFYDQGNTFPYCY